MNLQPHHLKALAAGRWTSITTLARMYLRGDRFLMTMITENAADEFTVIAVEAGGKDLAAVLEDHAHDIVGTATTLRGAQIRAAKYGRRWLAGESPASCSCTTIAHPEPGSSPCPNCPTRN